MLLVLAGCTGNATDYVRKGNEFHAAGNYAEATLNYRKAIQKQPDLGEAHYRLGLSLLKDGKKGEALQAFRRAVSAAPDLNDAKIQLANLLLEAYSADSRRPRRMYDELKTLSTALLSKDPQSVDGLRIQGNLALLDRQPDEALATFSKANQLHPLHPEVVHGLVQSLALKNQPAEAEKLCLALIAKDRTYGLIYDDLYAIYQATGRPADAERIFQIKVANNPGELIYRLQLAAHYINHNNQVEMEAALRPLREDTKTFPTGRLEVGEFYMRLRMWEEARAAFEEAGRSDSSRRLVARKRTIQALVGGGRISDAAQVAEEIAKEFPNDTETRFVRASLWLDLKDPAKAAAALEELEKLRTGRDRDPMFWHVLGQARQRHGDPRKAAAAFQEAVKLNPEFTPGLVALAELSLSTGQAKAALEFSQRAVAVNSTDPQLKLLHATALLQAGRSNEARSELSMLTRRYPQLADAELQLGVALLAERRYDEAETVFRKLYQPGQSDVRPLKGLAEVYMARKQGQRALDLVTAELKQNSNPHEVRLLYRRA